MGMTAAISGCALVVTVSTAEPTDTPVAMPVCVTRTRRGSDDAHVSATFAPESATTFDTISKSSPTRTVAGFGKTSRLRIVGATGATIFSSHALRAVQHSASATDPTKR